MAAMVEMLLQLMPAEPRQVDYHEQKVGGYKMI